ncbi:hypothetical protein CALCODRAFT_508510 [Calocera cornea HHB12733]|uniref:Uncharacterized protein n=1 Tax=Calocera cornea HHB12733 TaxID=1353952 RepID=A0A165GA39_9BASI|nr:hypothetical protein CALCODRAFT_508510 [Calocera cornea HHB12733]
MASMGSVNVALRVENEADAYSQRRFKYAPISLSALHVPLNGTAMLVPIPIVFNLHSNGIAEVYGIPIYTYLQGPYAEYTLEVHVHQEATPSKFTQQYHIISEYRTTKPSGPVSPVPGAVKLREWLGGVIVLRLTRMEKTDKNSLDYGNVTEADLNFLIKILEKGDPTTPLNPNSLLNMILHRSPEEYMMCT